MNFFGKKKEEIMHESLALIIKEGMAGLESKCVEAQAVVQTCKNRMQAVVELAEGIPEKFLNKFIVIAIGEGESNGVVHAFDIQIRAYDSGHGFNPQVREVVGSFKGMKPGKYRVTVLLEKLG